MSVSGLTTRTGQQKERDVVKLIGGIGQRPGGPRELLTRLHRDPDCVNIAAGHTEALDIDMGDGRSLAQEIESIRRLHNKKTELYRIAELVEMGKEKIDVLFKKISDDPAIAIAAAWHDDILKMRDESGWSVAYQVALTPAGATELMLRAHKGTFKLKKSIFKVSTFGSGMTVAHIAARHLDDE